jgi:hypothetical protein
MLDERGNANIQIDLSPAASNHLQVGAREPGKPKASDPIAFR